MTINATDRPPRAATYSALDAIRRKAQETERVARWARKPEPGIFAATVALPADLGEPDERLSGTSPILGLPFETLIYPRDKDTGQRVVFRRFLVKIHNFD